MTHEEYLKVLGERIVQARKENKMSQLELAEHVGTSNTHLRRVERGEVSCRITFLRDIAWELGLPLSELVNIG